jgi:predicted nucleotidyltransferase
MTDDVEGTIQELTRKLRDVLGDELVGFYLYGSKLSDDFDASASDVDLLAVLTVDLNEDRYARLAQLHEAFIRRHPEWDNRLDIVYIGRDTLASFRRGVGEFAVISPGEPFHKRTDVGDWIQSWFLVRHRNVALLGPPATTLIPAIERTEFIAAIKESLAGRAARSQAARGGALAYEVLTACRTLQTVETRSMPTKTQAAAWARERLPEWAWLIDAALVCRHSRGKVGFDDEATRSAAQQFMRDIAARVSGLEPLT